MTSPPPLRRTDGGYGVLIFILIREGMSFQWNEFTAYKHCTLSWFCTLSSRGEIYVTVGCNLTFNLTCPAESRTPQQDFHLWKAAPVFNLVLCCDLSLVGRHETSEIASKSVHLQEGCNTREHVQRFFCPGSTRWPHWMKMSLVRQTRAGMKMFSS